MSRWNRMVKPVLVLVLVCIVVSGSLAVAHSVTGPIIEAATLRAQEEARLELLPEANSFKHMLGYGVGRIRDISVAENGVGVIVTAEAKGYGGDMTVMVAFTADGTIKRIKVTEQAETKGIGSKVAANSAYWAEYEGLPAQKLVLNEDVDAVTGATKSSRALMEAVNAAVEGYHAVLPAVNWEGEGTR